MEKCIKILEDGKKDKNALVEAAHLVMKRFVESKGCVSCETDLMNQFYECNLQIHTAPADFSRAVVCAMDCEADESVTVEQFEEAVGTFLKIYWYSQCKGLKYVLYPVEYPALARNEMETVLSEVLRKEATVNDISSSLGSIDMLDRRFYVPEELRQAVLYLRENQVRVKDATAYNRIMAAVIKWVVTDTTMVPLGTGVKYVCTYRDNCFLYSKGTYTIYGAEDGLVDSEVRSDYYCFDNPTAIIRAHGSLRDGYYRACAALKDGLVKANADENLLRQVMEELVRRVDDEDL